MGILQRSLAGMSNEQRIAALNTLFTRDAINSASILAGLGAGRVDEYAASVAEISAAETAAIRVTPHAGSCNWLPLDKKG